MARTSTFRRRIAAILGLVLLACILGSGYIKTSTGPAEGSFHPAGLINPILRVATYNIHSGIGSDGKFDLGRTAAALKGFDVVGLNEARGPISGEDQVKLLGDKLSMESLFVPTERQWFHPHFGNGLLVGIPAQGWKRTALPHTFGRGMRNLLATEITTPTSTLHLFTTHIDHETDRHIQLDIVIKAFLDSPEPAIIMGDFNTKASDPALTALHNHPGVTDCLSQSLGQKLPADNIDWIFMRGLKLRAAGLADNGASDHPMAWAELELPVRPATRP